MRTKKLNGHPIWRTLIFLSTGSYGVIFLIGCNSGENEDMEVKQAGMVIDYKMEYISTAN